VGPLPLASSNGFRDAKYSLTCSGFMPAVFSISSANIALSLAEVYPSGFLDGKSGEMRGVLSVASGSGLDPRRLKKDLRKKFDFVCVISSWWFIVLLDSLLVLPVG